MKRLLRLADRRDLLAALLLAAVVSIMYLPNLGSYAFWDPWESQYSQVAMEMADHGTWCNPWYRGEDRWWSKPILLMWLLRLSFAAFGVDDPSHPSLHLAGRMPIFFLGLLGVLLTYAWVSRLANRRAGIYSGLVLATCPFYALVSHQVMYDLPFVVFCSAALGFFFLARGSAGRPAHLFWFYGLCGLAFLSKWLLAFYIPAGILLAEIVLRWNWEFFRRVGLVALLALAGCLVVGGGGFWLATRDLPFAGMLTVALAGLLLVWLMGAATCREKGFGARYFWLAFGLLLLLIVPWHAYMVAKHGWPFVREAIIYHHFERAAGTIGKPEGTFEVYFQQIAFGTFPWVALLPAALLRLLRSGNAGVQDAQNGFDLRLLLAALVPWAAFSLFQTKFHHYIFPVVPFLAVAVGVFLERSRTEADGNWMKQTVLLAAPVAAVMLADIRLDYKPFIHLFDYYYGWPLPAEINPYPLLLTAGGFFLAVLAALFFMRKIGTLAFAALFACAATVTVGLCAWVLPGVTRNFTQYPIYQAYLHKGGGAPIAQYNGWLSRSVSFYFRNRAVDLSRADRPNLDAAIEFLARPSRSFLILGAGYGQDCRSLLASLRPEVNKRLGKSLYVVFDKHNFSCLVSTERDPDGELRVRESLLSELPEGVTKSNVDFGGKIELLGWKIEPAQIERGGSFKVSYFFRCLQPVGDDWLVFIHGDGPQGGAHRVFGDHAPLGGLYPTSEWKPGEIIRDETEMRVPSNYPYQYFTLWMGFWKGDLRLPVAQKFMHDGADRVRTAMIRLK